MLYGVSPFDDLKPIDALLAAMTLSAPIIAVNQVCKGDTVGYGNHFLADADCWIAVVGIGYGDGYPREVSTGTTVFVNGKRQALAGRVSMDMMTIKLDDGDQVAIGDKVELWGRKLPIEEIARRAGTIPYTLMCGVTKRVPRKYTRT